MGITSLKQVSIVIVTFNSSHTIEKLLSSLMTEVKIIDTVFIIDNNSGDKKTTKKIVNHFINQTSLNIKYIQNDNNFGFGKACNIAINLVKTKYVLFINPDTYVHKNSLKILFNHAESESADLIGGVCQKSEKTYHRTIVKKLDLVGGIFELTSIGKILKTNIGINSFYYAASEYNNPYDFKVGAISGAYLMVKRDSFYKLGGFDEEYFMYLEDVDLGYRAQLLGMNVVFCPHSKITHIGGASSNNKHKINYLAWSNSRKKYFSKNANILENIIIQPIFIVEDFLIYIKSLIKR